MGSAGVSPAMLGDSPNTLVAAWWMFMVPEHRTIINEDFVKMITAFKDARELYVAAPYFGGSLQGVELLATRYPAARLHIFPAVHSGQATDVPLPQLHQSYPNARVAQLSVPNKKNALAHLKLYGIALADGTARLYCASANCTEAAWKTSQAL